MHIFGGIFFSRGYVKGSKRAVLCIDQGQLKQQWEKQLGKHWLLLEKVANP